VNFTIKSGWSADIQRCFCITLFACLISACTPHISPPAAIEYTQAPTDFPAAYYLQAETSGSNVLRIDALRSLVAITVRRGGALARLGHDHVVASHDLTGYVDITAGRADLYVPLERLSVDEPVLRAEAALTTQPSADAIEGTRRNMLDRVLESERFPFALIRVNRSPVDRSKLAVVITLHGTTHNFEIPAQIVTLSNGIEINGKMEFDQTDFGITPFSILGGALQVEDRVGLRFRIFAVNS